MALFSRRPKKNSDETGDVPVDAQAELSDVQQDASAAVAAEQADAEPVPFVPISVSTYGQPSPRPEPPRLPKVPETAPERTEGRPGMPDNTLLLAALADAPEQPDNAAILGVTRQALQGTLYLRILGDAQAQVAAGEPLRLAISIMNDKKFLLAYTGAAAVQAGLGSDAEENTNTSILGQPAQNVLRNVVDAGYDGIVFDHAGPGRRIVLPTGLISRALDQADPDFTIKNLLAGPRTPETARAVVDALVARGAWIAAGPRPDGQGMGVAEARSAEGTRYLQVFSHPLEVLVLRREDQPMPLTAAQLGEALKSEPELSGFLVDAAGPWIRLEREQLDALITIADAAETVDAAAEADASDED
ncbi:SseB family protein [Microbacterium sp. MM2322]|uniref:SseB family protein n=1 Tax=Microbacterium sp. MM2322 TaxID=3157631 RepID=UPI0032D5993D